MKLILVCSLLAAPALAAEPELVSPLGKQLYALEDTKGAVVKADAALAADPGNPDMVLAAARARDELWRYREAIEMYSRGVASAPGDFRFWRFRGHRYISTRQFAKAIADMEKASALASSSFDVAYHLGLSYYLSGRYDKAAQAYGRCLDMAGRTDLPKLPEGIRSCGELATHDDSRVAITDWLYRSLRRAGRGEEAGKLLETITDGMKITTNDFYFQALLYYRGRRTEAQILGMGTATGNQYSTVGYAVANRHLLDGRREQACDLFRRIVEEKTWSAFGYIAAEAELAQGTCKQ